MEVAGNQELQPKGGSNTPYEAELALFMRSGTNIKLSIIYHSIRHLWGPVSYVSIL